MSKDLTLPPTLCIDCMKYPMLLEWYKEEDFVLPEECKHCRAVMHILEN